MKVAKGSVMIVARSTAIQFQMCRSLIPSKMKATCLLLGTDFASKKLRHVFLNSIITDGVTSLLVKTGTLPLVGSMVAVFNMFCVIFNGIYVLIITR